jgi:hypothetical protein
VLSLDEDVVTPSEDVLSLGEDVLSLGEDVLSLGEDVPQPRNRGFSCREPVLTPLTPCDDVTHGHETP